MANQMSNAGETGYISSEQQHLSSFQHQGGAPQADSQVTNNYNGQQPQSQWTNKFSNESSSYYYQNAYGNSGGNYPTNQLNQQQFMLTGSDFNSEVFATVSSPQNPLGGADHTFNQQVYMQQVRDQTQHEINKQNRRLQQKAVGGMITSEHPGAGFNQHHKINNPTLSTMHQPHGQEVVSVSVFDEYETSGRQSGSEATTAFINGANPHGGAMSKMIHSSNLSRVANQGGSHYARHANLTPHMERQEGSPSKISQSTDSNQIKVARFKKIDWQQVQSKLIKPLPPHIRLQNSPLNVTSGNLDLYGKQSPDQIAPVLINDSAIQWINQLPKLRKNIQYLEPGNMHGAIWPQKGETFSRRNVIVNSNSPELMRSHGINAAQSPAGGAHYQAPRFHNTDKRKGRRSPRHLMEGQLAVQGQTETLYQAQLRDSKRSPSQKHSDDCCCEQEGGCMAPEYLCQHEKQLHQKFKLSKRGLEKLFNEERRKQDGSEYHHQRLTQERFSTVSPVQKQANVMRQGARGSIKHIGGGVSISPRSSRLLPLAVAMDSAAYMVKQNKILLSPVPTNIDISIQKGGESSTGEVSQLETAEQQRAASVSKRQDIGFQTYQTDSANNTQTSFRSRKQMDASMDRSPGKLQIIPGTGNYAIAGNAQPMSPHLMIQPTQSPPQLQVRTIKPISPSEKAKYKKMIVAKQQYHVPYAMNPTCETANASVTDAEQDSILKTADSKQRSQIRMVRPQHYQRSPIAHGLISPTQGPDKDVHVRIHDSGIVEPVMDTPGTMHLRERHNRIRGQKQVDPKAKDSQYPMGVVLFDRQSNMTIPINQSSHQSLGNKFPALKNEKAAREQDMQNSESMAIKKNLIMETEGEEYVTPKHSNQNYGKGSKKKQHPHRMSHDTGVTNNSKNDFKETVQIRYMLQDQVNNNQKKKVVQPVEKQVYEMPKTNEPTSQPSKKVINTQQASIEPTGNIDRNTLEYLERVKNIQQQTHDTVHKKRLQQETHNRQHYKPETSRIVLKTKVAEKHDEVHQSVQKGRNDSMGHFRTNIDLRKLKVNSNEACTNDDVSEQTQSPTRNRQADPIQTKTVSEDISPATIPQASEMSPDTRKPSRLVQVDYNQVEADVGDGNTVCTLNGDVFQRPVDGKSNNDPIDRSPVPLLSTAQRQIQQEGFLHVLASESSEPIDRDFGLHELGTQGSQDTDILEKYKKNSVTDVLASQESQHRVLKKAPEQSMRALINPTNKITMPVHEGQGHVHKNDAQTGTFHAKHKSQVRATIRLGGGRIIADGIDLTSPAGLTAAGQQTDLPERPSAFTSNYHKCSSNLLKSPRHSKFPGQTSASLLGAIMQSQSPMDQMSSNSTVPTLLSRVFNMSTIPNVIRFQAVPSKEDHLMTPKQPANVGSHGNSQLTSVITGLQMQKLTASVVRDGTTSLNDLSVGVPSTNHQTSQFLCAAQQDNCQKKRIEETMKIVDRVTRANCCLQPENPEQTNVLKRAVGDGSEYLSKPSANANRIRLKLLNNKFMQGLTEDFIAVQNLEKNVNQTIITTNEFWLAYNIIEDDERQLITRFFKRFFYKTIEKKYGYLKSHATDKVEISGRILCTELELNPKVLQCFDVITTYNYGGDAMVSWITFVKVVSIFILRKDCSDQRFDFILKFLNVASTTIVRTAEDEEKRVVDLDARVLRDLFNNGYMADKVQKFQFFKKDTVTVEDEIQGLWNRIRSALLEQAQHIWRDTGVDSNKQGIQLVFDLIKAREVLKQHMTPFDTFSFFDLLFDVL